MKLTKQAHIFKILSELSIACEIDPELIIEQFTGYL